MNELLDDILKLTEAVRQFTRAEIAAEGVPLPPEDRKDSFWLLAEKATKIAIQYAMPGYVGLMCFAANVGFTSAQLKDSGWSVIDNVRATIEKAESQWYLRYWNLLGPYYSVSELLSLFNMSSMVEFYTRFGIPPAVDTAANNYAAGQISMAELRQTMFLDTDEQVVQSLGTFGPTIISRRFLTDNGYTFTNEEVVGFLQTSSKFYKSLTDEQKQTVDNVTAALQDANITTMAQMDNFFLTNMYGDGSNYNMVSSNETDTTLTGTDLSDIIYGNNNNNTITGGAGNDIISGFGGDDLLEGESGNDTYLFGLNDGNDTISDFAMIGEENKLVMTSGIFTNDISLSQVNDDLVLSLVDELGSVTIKNWFTNVIGGTWQLSEIIFDSTGDVWTPADIAEMLAAPAPDADPQQNNMNASNYQLDRAIMNIAIADMGLTADEGEQVGESLGYMPNYDSGEINVSTGSSSDVLLEKDRKSA